MIIIGKKNKIIAFKNRFDEFHENCYRLAKNIIKGQNSETEIGVYLDNNLKAESLILLNTVFIDKYENDLIIISEKGLFTLEIKNHKCTMQWRDGEFVERRGKAELKGVNDPYKQALNHKKTLEELLESRYQANSYVILANNATEYNADDKDILNSVYYIDEFIKHFNNLESIYTTDQVEELYALIQEKRLQKKYMFEYPDIYRFDKLYKGWIERLTAVENDKRQGVMDIIYYYQKYKNYYSIPEFEQCHRYTFESYSKVGIIAQLSWLATIMLLCSRNLFEVLFGGNDTIYYTALFFAVVLSLVLGLFGLYNLDVLDSQIRENIEIAKKKKTYNEIKRYAEDEIIKEIVKTIETNCPDIAADCNDKYKDVCRVYFEH